jgi:hypothetical protein
MACNVALAVAGDVAAVATNSLVSVAGGDILRVGKSLWQPESTYTLNEIRS